MGGNGLLRIVETGEACARTETPLHWTVREASTEELDAFKAQLAALGERDLVHWTNLAALPDRLADGEISYDDL